MDKMPHWADVVLVPLVSLLLAALLSALVKIAGELSSAELAED